MADVFVRAARVIDAGEFAGVQRRSWLDASNSIGLPMPPDADFMERSWEKAVMAPPSDRHQTWVAVETSTAERSSSVWPPSHPPLTPTSTPVAALSCSSSPLTRHIGGKGTGRASWPPPFRPRQRPESAK